MYMKKNIQKICLPKKDKKSLHKQNAAKIINCKKGQDNVKGGKIYKRNMYLMKEIIIMSKKISISLTMMKHMLKV